MAFNWDTSSPADDGVISQFPANERAARTASRGAFNVDHDADGTGYHKQVTLSDPGRGPTFASTMLGRFQRSGTLYRKLANGTKYAIPYLATGSSGDEVVVYQAAAPTGWTQDTAVNDRVLRIVSGTGAGTGGSWTITGLTADAHTHTQQGTFGTGNNSNGGAVGNQGFAGQFATRPHTHSVTISGQTGAASATGVTHTPSWRPSYVDVIACYMT